MSTASIDEKTSPDNFGPSPDQITRCSYKRRAVALCIKVPVLPAYYKNYSRWFMIGARKVLLPVSDCKVASELRTEPLCFCLIFNQDML